MNRLSILIATAVCLLLTTTALAQSAREPAQLDSQRTEESVSCEGACTTPSGETGTKEMLDGQCFCVINTAFEAAAERSDAAAAHDDEIQAAANRCTAAGCASACAPNTCVGFRATATGCRYSCLLNTVADPVRAPN